MTRTLRRAILSCLIASVAVGGLSACRRMYEPGHLTKERVQVTHEEFFDRQPVAAIGPAYLESLAREYSRKGEGPLTLTITYDPHSSTNTAMKASDNAAALSRELQQAGVPVQADILPVAKSGSLSEALIGYSGYAAHAPAGCGTMSGYADTDLNSNLDYSLGCTIETVIAKQVSRPGDLLGRGQEDNLTEGRSATNIVAPVHAGVQNKELKGKTASE